jgi:hypothetical protein
MRHYHLTFISIVFCSLCFFQCDQADVKPRTKPTIASIGTVSMAGSQPLLTMKWYWPSNELVQSFKIEKSVNNGNFNVVAERLPATTREFAERVDYVNYIRYKITANLTNTEVSSIIVAHRTYLSMQVLNSLCAGYIAASPTEKDNSNKVYLTWFKNPNVANSTLYRIERQKNNTGAFIAKATVRADSIYVLDNDISAGNSYKYRMVGVATNNCYSNIYEITVPRESTSPCAHNLTASVIELNNKRTIALNWTAALGEKMSYRVERSESRNDSWEVVTPFTANSTVYIENAQTLQAGTLYHYRVVPNDSGVMPLNCPSCQADVVFY